MTADLPTARIEPTTCVEDNFGCATLVERNRDYRRMARVLAWLRANFESQPSLAEAARQASLSEGHFQRLFSRWVGLSPQRFVQFLTLEKAKRCLNDSRSVMDAALEAGLSGPGRLHDLFVRLEAMSPGEYKLGGEGLTIRYGFSPSPFGECLIFTTRRGICGLAFTDHKGREATVAELRRPYPRAKLLLDQVEAAALGERIFDATPGRPVTLNVLVRGTAFQVKVWEALLRIPPGTVISYSELARGVGQPGANRAVANANAANAICYLIPCHRVIRANGELGGYRWGIDRKLAMLSFEQAHDEARTTS